MRILRTLAAGEAGTALVEFTVLLPLLFLMLAAAIDFGAVLYVKFRLNEAVSAGSNYAMLHGDSISDTASPELATDIATLVANSGAPGWATGYSLVNNGPYATTNDFGTTPGGSTSTVDNCYCLTMSSGEPSWGAPIQCATPCPAGGYSGRFVVVRASHPYDPVFSNYGFVKNGRISVQAVIQTQ